MIYILEDDNNIAELITYTLKTQNMEAKAFHVPSDFFQALQEFPPKLILLDIMLPEQDGLSILQQLKNKSQTANIPVILLTAKDNEFDKVKGLDMGADDYITKPFGILELLARIKAILRRINNDKKTTFIFKDFYFDVQKHIASINNIPLKLTLKEFNLLYLFLCNPNIVFTRDQIASLVWKDDCAGASRTIDIHIKTLRKKLGIYGDLITTIRGVGYKFDKKILE